MAESAVTLNVAPALDPEAAQQVVDQLREQTKQAVLDGLRSAVAIIAGCLDAFAELQQTNIQALSDGYAAGNVGDATS